jgi:ATP-binding cassette subfamily B protein
MLLLGDISSFVLYSKKFSGPINEIANIVTDLQSALAAAERVFELIDEKEELKDEQNAISLDVEDGNVSFKNVYFGYSANKLILKDISFDALSGKQIAIVGPTGSGKTTIVNLLMRFYDINSGAIYLDNNNIQMIKRKDLRLSYAMVLQDTWLFEGTVYDNLIYGNDNVTFDDVKSAATAARIDTFIESLPNGYDTILSEGGTNISKGQKQLLTIARAMLLDAKMLILDEATSNVDTRTEIKIQEAMKNLMKDKTSFIIAHRLSTIKNADTILVIKDGEIVEQGNHIELLNKNGFYKELYISQFNN